MSRFTLQTCHLWTVIDIKIMGPEESGRKTSQFRLNESGWLKIKRDPVISHALRIIDRLLLVYQRSGIHIQLWIPIICLAGEELNFSTYVGPRGFKSCVQMGSTNKLPALRFVTKIINSKLCYFRDIRSKKNEKFVLGQNLEKRLRGRSASLIQCSLTRFWLPFRIFLFFDPQS